MRILNISHTTKGGAGTAVERTHNRLLDLGYDSHLFLYDDIHIERKQTLKEKLISRFKKRLTHYLIKYTGFDLEANQEKYCFNSTSELKNIDVSKLLNIVKDGDLLFFYWTGLDLVNTKNFRELYLSAKIRIFWYALDMAAVTGGCHYYWDCRGYLSNCSNCPAVNVFKKSLPKKQLEVKKNNLKNINATLIASSQIGINIFKEASLKFDQYFNLPYAIDTEVFNLSTDKSKNPNYRIFFSSQNTLDGRKGFTLFQETIYELSRLLKTSNIEIDLISLNSIEHSSKFIEQKNIHVKAVEQPKNSSNELASLYQNSDLFICTSIEDLSPLMVNEALLCGIPVLCFNNASNREYILNNKNGYMTDKIESIEMAKIAFQIINGSIQFQSAREIRSTVYPIHEKENWHVFFLKLIDTQ